MHTLSYTISPVLQQTLKEIDNRRQQIVLYPLSPATEISLRWEVTISRIYYALHLAHNPVTHKEIIRMLISPGRRSVLQAEKDILTYKQGMDYIVREWLVNSKPVMPQTVYALYKILAGDKTHLSEPELMEILIFLQTSRENPLIQAFIAYTQFVISVPQNDITSKISHLLPYLFLYKAGLDFRGLLVIESYFYHNERLMREMFEAIARRESMSVWIEHFIQSIAGQLEETLNKLAQSHVSQTSDQMTKLTERQKEILSAFEQPGVRITNRKVQHLFRISQITASRDLAKLSALGLLFPYGKGRSVYYTRA